MDVPNINTPIGLQYASGIFCLSWFPSCVWCARPLPCLRSCSTSKSGIRSICKKPGSKACFCVWDIQKSNGMDLFSVPVYLVQMIAFKSMFRTPKANNKFWSSRLSEDFCILVSYLCNQSFAVVWINFSWHLSIKQFLENIAEVSRFEYE